MAAATVAAVYATGLLELADQLGKRDAIVDDSMTLRDSLAARPELLAVADSPRLSRDQVKELLKGCFQGKIADELVKLLLVLVDRNRLPDTRGILDEVIRQADEAAGRIDFVVTTAAEIDADLRDRLISSVTKTRGPNVRFSFHIDESIIGGLRAQIGNERVLDASVSRHLKEMKQRILEAPVTAAWDDDATSEGASA